MSERWHSFKPPETIEEHRAEAFRHGQYLMLDRALETCRRSRGALRAIKIAWDEDEEDAPAARGQE